MREIRTARDVVSFLREQKRWLQDNCSGSEPSTGEACSKVASAIEAAIPVLRAVTHREDLPLDLERLRGVGSSSCVASQVVSALREEYKTIQAWIANTPEIPPESRSKVVDTASLPEEWLYVIHFFREQYATGKTPFFRSKLQASPVLGQVTEWLIDKNLVHEIEAPFPAGSECNEIRILPRIADLEIRVEFSDPRTPKDWKKLYPYGDRKWTDTRNDNPYEIIGPDDKKKPVKISRRLIENWKMQLPEFQSTRTQPAAK